jgi:ABC-type transport system involved in multi-copper enzyme maturation permease subunit
MIRVVRAELLKVRSTRLWVGLLIGSLLLNGAGALLLLALAGTEEGRQAGLTPVRTTEDVRLIVQTGAQAFLFVLVLAATMATTEYRYATAAGTYLTTPHRGRVVTAKSVAAIPVGALFGLLSGLLALVIVLGWFAVKGGGPSIDQTVALAVAEDALQCAYAGVLGVALGVAIRSQVVAILAVLGWTLVVEPLVSSLLPSVLPWMPFAGVASVFGPENPELFGRPEAAALMLTYALSAWVAAVVVERRRDV